MEKYHIQKKKKQKSTTGENKGPAPKNEDQNTWKD